MPKVSIIVPNYNHALFLEKRLNSIFNQTFQDFEVILLDDCSTDNSIELLSEYSKNERVSRFIINDVNSGSTFKQWEKGIDLANGKYIWIAESDDFSESTFLSEMIDILENDQTLNFAFCKSNWIDDKNEIGKDLSIYGTSFKKGGMEEIRDKLVYYNSIQNASSVLFRAFILKRPSKKYTQYLSCGDWILYAEILQNGSLYFSEKVLNNFRWYHNNVSNNAAKQGLWIYEGVDVLKIAKRNLKFTNAEKARIISLWMERIKPLRSIIPFSLKKYFLIHLKLFLFSPFAYFRLISVKK